MPKLATTYPLVLPPRPAGATAQEWVAGALRRAILGGRLAPGARLPATRDLARQYRLARGTIVAVFDRLRGEGYIEGSVGSGTYVNRVLPDDLLQVPHRGTGSRPAGPTSHRRFSHLATGTTRFPNLEARPTRAFRANEPALDRFPTGLWATVAARRLRGATTAHLRGSEPLGYPPLRDAVADYIRTSRGVNCLPDQIVIVSGVQEALDLTARLFVNRGDRVCMEDPGYPGASLVFQAFGARVQPVPVDAEGMTIPTSRMKGARLAYVTPAHQFPLGISMTLARRLALLEWARQSRALIFEDDYDGEYRYSGRPLPALQGLDRAGLVLFAGSFSKVLFPALRLGYLVVPPDLVDRFEATKSITNRHAPMFDQLVLTDFIAAGHFGRHVRRMREIYAERLGVLLESAQEHLGGLLEISGVEAGLQTVGRLGIGLDEESAALAAGRRDVIVTPLSRYRRGRARNDELQLGFAAVDPSEIRRGVRELARALELLRKS